MNKITVKQTFGFSPIVSNAISFCEDHQLVYISGNQISVLNTDSKEQNFILLHHTGNIINIPTALACSNIKRTIAIAEKNDTSAMITFYDSTSLKKKKSFHHNELGTNHIISMAFSDDGKQFITQGAGPEWNMMLWNIEKVPKVIASYKTTTSDDWPVTTVSFCPWDHTCMIAYGRNVFKVLKIFDGIIRNQNIFLRRDFIHIKAHCWLMNDRLILATDTGELILLENLEYRGVILSPLIQSPIASPRGERPSTNHHTSSFNHMTSSLSSTGNDNSNNNVAYSIVPTSRGFMIGGKKGEIRLFERRDDHREYYTCEDTCYLPERSGSIINLMLGSDDTIICATDNQQILSTIMTNLFNKRDTINMFEPILTSFHGSHMDTNDAAITSIDVALWKNLIVTCGRDHSVRLWNPNDHKIEVIRYYDDEPVSVAIHPSGLHMAIAFLDKIVMTSILLDDISTYAEVSIRSCAHIKYSHGGQYLAAIAGSSIYIYDTYTMCLITTLRGHGNKIRSIVWMHHDNKIMSVGVDGAVFYWTPFSLTTTRPLQYNHTGAFLCGTTMQDGSRAYVCTNEKVLKEFSFTRSIDPTTGMESKLREPRDIILSRSANHILLNEAHDLLILASNDPNQPGALMTMMIGDDINDDNSINIQPIHAHAITAMILSYDCKTIISGDAKGCLIISVINHDDDKHIIINNNISSTSSSSYELVDEVQIKRSELDTRNMMIDTLSSRVNELNLNNDFQVRLKEMEYNETVKELAVKFDSQYQGEHDKYQVLLSDKKESECTLKIKLRTLLSKQDAEVHDIESKYKLKIDAESNRHLILSHEVDDMHKRWNDENRSLMDSHQRYVQELTEEYEDKIHAEQAMQKTFLQEKEMLQVTYDDHRVKVEYDVEYEMDELRLKYDGRLRNEVESSKELKEQHTSLHREIVSLTKESELYKDEIRKLKEKEARLIENMRSLEKDIQSHKKEIREREEAISDKEKRIFDLKKKNQELEKFRFVLDYKIKELKLQIAPREKEIAIMQKQIEEMGLELEQYHKSNLALNLMIQDLKLKIDGLRKEYNAHEERAELTLRLLDKVKRDLQEMSTSINDPRALKQHLVKMCRVYLQDDMLAANSSKSNTSTSDKQKIPDPQEAYNRDREQMERSLDALRRAVRTDARARKRDFMKMVRDNVILTREINDLRKEGNSLTIQRRIIDKASKEGKLTSADGISDVLLQLGIKLRQSRHHAARQPQIEPHHDMKMNMSQSRRPSAISFNIKNINGDGIILSSTTPSSSSAMISKDIKHKKRSAALRNTSADGKMHVNHMTCTANDEGDTIISGAKDNYEAWCTIQCQQKKIRELESSLQAICGRLDMDALDILAHIDDHIDDEDKHHSHSRGVKLI